MKPRVDRCRAYTLIEIMLVVAIMLIIVSVGVPSLFKSLRKDALRGAVSDVLSTCAQARAQAILSGGPVEFVMTVFAVDDLRLSIQPGRRRDAGGEGEESLPPLTMLDADEELGNSDAPGSVRIHEDIAVQRTHHEQCYECIEPYDQEIVEIGLLEPLWDSRNNFEKAHEKIFDKLPATTEKNAAMYPGSTCRDFEKWLKENFPNSKKPVDEENSD